MKKIISIILALVMMFTAALPAFAAETESDIVCGEKKVFDLAEYYFIRFIPEKTGIYTLKSELAEGKKANVKVGSESTDLNRRKNSSDILYFIAEEDSPIGINAYNNDYKGKVALEINEFNPESLNVGENNITIGKNKNYFSFVPEKDGYYNFTSVCDGDPMIEIITDSNTKFENDNNGRKDDKNFDSTVYLNAGNPSLVMVNTVSDSGTVPCKVIVTPDKNEKIESLVLYEDFPLNTVISKSTDNSGFGSYFCIKSTPAGALAGKDVKITSSDEDIVIIDYYDEDSGMIHYSSGKKAGSAVITVEADGVTESIKIKVASLLMYILFYTPIRFAIEIFYSIFHGQLF